MFGPVIGPDGKTTPLLVYVAGAIGAIVLVALIVWLV